MIDELIAQLIDEAEACCCGRGSPHSEACRLPQALDALRTAFASERSSRERAEGALDAARQAYNSRSNPDLRVALFAMAPYAVTPSPLPEERPTETELAAEDAEWEAVFERNKDKLDALTKKYRPALRPSTPLPEETT